MSEQPGKVPLRKGPASLYRAIGAALVFLIALTAALQYQRTSQPLLEVQADAGKYLTAAFNIFVHDAHSLDPPTLTRSPATRTDLSPGYPFFLSLFFTSPPDSRTLLPRVELAQAVLAAASAALAVLLAAMALPLWAALVVGVLVALNPHLIALSATMLTETLFVFLVSLGLFLFTLGWRRAQSVLVFLALIALGLAAEVRTIGIVLPLLLTPLCLLRPGAEPGRTAGKRAAMLAGCVLATITIWGVHQAFFLAYGETNDGRRGAPEYQRIGSPLAYLANGARPPNYVVDGISHSLADHAEADWRRRADVAFLDEPLAYAKWNLWERWRVLWDFESAYTGTAEPYPMQSSAFEGGGLLDGAQTLMKVLHWPLALLTIAGIVVVVLARAGRLAIPARCVDALLPVSVAFCGFFLVLAMIDWLPRYSVPVRAASYLLALAPVLLLVQRQRTGTR